MSGINHDVDSLTHSFVIGLAFPASAPPVYLFAAVLGAIIPDIDILFKPLSDRHPSLFILTHGGFTHSIAGAAVVAGLSWLRIVLGVIAGACPSCPNIPRALFMIIFAGACTHLFLTAWVFPGYHSSIRYR